MKYKIDLQVISTDKHIPNQFQLQRWVNTALDGRMDSAELCIRIVDELESKTLNKHYRSKDTPTNVLSFPSDLPDDVELQHPLLGDLIICAPIVAKEAKQQQKAVDAHWAHMVIHGSLHLLGFDHIKDDEAEIMEAIEIELLATLGYPNPYGEQIEHE